MGARPLGNETIIRSIRVSASRQDTKSSAAARARLPSNDEKFFFLSLRENALIVITSFDDHNVTWSNREKKEWKDRNGGGRKSKARGWKHAARDQRRGKRQTDRLGERTTAFSLNARHNRGGGKEGASVRENESFFAVYSSSSRTMEEQRAGIGPLASTIESIEREDLVVIPRLACSLEGRGVP